MFILRTIFNLLTMGNVMVDNPVPQHLISKILRTVSLVVVTSVLFVALILTGFVSLYHYLLSLDIPQLDATLYILGGIAVLTVLAMIFTYRQACCLKKSFLHGIKKPVPLTSHLTDEVTNVVKSFFTGFLRRDHRTYQRTY